MDGWPRGRRSLRRAASTRDSIPGQTRLTIFACGTAAPRARTSAGAVPEDPGAARFRLEQVAEISLIPPVSGGPLSLSLSPFPVLSS